MAQEIEGPDVQKMAENIWNDVMKVLTTNPQPTKWWFRRLSEEEEEDFRQNARDNYKPFTTIEGIWHPVYQQECVTINIEHSVFTDR